MKYLGRDYQKERIKKNQKFLLKLLHLHIGNYYPLRKYLGIDYKGKIDEISHLSIAYNTKRFPKGGKWYKQVTRTYQHSDLGYKLNLVLDKIPQLALLPALLQPAYGLGALALFFLTQTTYQPSTKDARIRDDNPDTNYGSLAYLDIGRNENINLRSVIHFDTTDIPDNATFSQGDIMLYCYLGGVAPDVTMYRLTQTAWVENEVTWNSYSTGNAWDSAGGDYTATNAVLLENLDLAGWNTWDATSLIQDCYDNQSKNAHLFVKSSEVNGEWARPYSKEEATNTTLRPKLTVTYTTSTQKSVSDSGSGADAVGIKEQIKVEDKNLPSISYF